MQRLTRCMVWLGAFAALWACSGDPTNNKGTPTEIVANPSIVFVTQGDSQAVDVSVVDEDGQSLKGDFSFSNVGPGISVVQDTAFQRTETVPGSTVGHAARFFVKGVDLTSSSFTVNALGLTKVVPVSSVPGFLVATISDTVPAPGVPVTLTAPAGLTFDPTSQVTVGLLSMVITARDATSITFIPAPNIDGPLTVTKVIPTSNPTLKLTLATSTSIRTVVLTAVAGTFSNPTPALGQTITFTLPADVRIDPAGAGDVLVAGAPVPPANVTISADSGTITLVPPPSSDSTLILPGVVQRQLPQYPQTLASTTKVTTPRIDSIAVTFSNSTPALAQAVTATAPAGFTFTTPAAGPPPVTGSTITFNGAPGVIQAQTATTITFIPIPTTSGAPLPANATVTDVVPTAAPMFSLTLPSTTPLTLPNLTPLRFTNDPARAPLITVPGPGGTTTIFDAGAYNGPSDCCFGFATRLYKVTLAAPTTLTFTVDWFEGQDMGVYILQADAATVIDAGDDGLEGPTGHPETVTVSLATGTYFAAIPNFSDTDPGLIKLTVHNP